MPEGHSHAHVGILMVALWIVGAGGVLAALAAAYDQKLGEAGLCLVASALAFGQLLNALVRK